MTNVLATGGMDFRASGSIFCKSSCYPDVAAVNSNALTYAGFLKYRPGCSKAPRFASTPGSIRDACRNQSRVEAMQD